MAANKDMMILYRRLSIDDLDDISDLESNVWPVQLRASKDCLEKRLLWGHTMMGAFRENRLSGIASWRYDKFDPDNASTMPQSFNQFSNQPNVTPSNAAFVYNFALLPGIRNGRIGPNLITESTKILFENHCQYLVGASRCPSYSSANQKLQLDIRNAISHYSSDEPPWLLDPVLNFYSRTLNCIFTEPIANFMPEDLESGGYAIGFYKTLKV
jgi:hypothetical protein